MIGLLNRRRVQAMTQAELDRACRQLSEEWIRGGSPPEDEMNEWLLSRYLVLKAERERRGNPQRLF